MKKTNKIKKLNLDKFSIRVLLDHDLKDIVGGYSEYPCAYTYRCLVTYRCE